MYQDTSSTTNRLESYISDLKPAKRTRKARRQVNYRSASTKATLAKQEAIRSLLAAGLPFTVRAIGDALGISRQLALYHVKKMAAMGQLIMMLEPCEKNGGLQFRCWDETALMAHYAVRAQRALRAA